MFVKRLIKKPFELFRGFMSAGMPNDFARIDEINWQIAKNRLTDYALHSNIQGTTNREYLKGKKIIVSLTSYGKRLSNVYLAIESIMQQTYKPNKIILWLDYGLKDKPLPEILNNQINRGLQIAYCDDLKSYKKLLPAMKAYPTDCIITIDDDIIYRFDVVEKLICAYIANPGLIYFTRGHRIKLDNYGNIEKYIDWEWCVDDEIDSPFNFPTGGGGTIYPPATLFNPEIMRDDVFMMICPHADDVWFKAMALLSNISSRKVETQSDSLLFSPDNQDTGLLVKNVLNNQNDVQIKAVFNKYGLINKLISIGTRH